MKAAFVIDEKRPDGNYKTAIREIDKPVLKPNQVMLKNKYVGICGSDLHVFTGQHAFRHPPVILGHEMSGEIVEVGSAVTKFKVGDRVTVDPTIPCGECSCCKNGLPNLCTHRQAPGTGDWIGCFAEYFPADEVCVHKLADTTPYDIGALTEPMSIGCHVLSRIQSTKRDSMCILGAGTIGLSVLYLAKLAGFQKILVSDIAPYNLSMAKEFGATVCINPMEQDLDKAVQEMTGGEGVDVTVDAAGAPGGLNSASINTRRGGEIVVVAMATRPQEFVSYNIVFREQTIRASQLELPEDFQASLDIINNPANHAMLRKFITHCLPMEEVETGLELLTKRGEKKDIKILIQVDKNA